MSKRSNGISDEEFEQIYGQLLRLQASQDALTEMVLTLAESQGGKPAKLRKTWTKLLQTFHHRALELLEDQDPSLAARLTHEAGLTDVDVSLLRKIRRRRSCGQ